jgi:hypothetical protein
VRPATGTRPCALLAAAVIALSGCASVPHATDERDLEAKRFLARPEAATVYVYRPDFTAREGDESVLFVNDRIIGATLPGTYFRVDLRAGPHFLHGYAYDQGRLKVEPRYGEIVFVSLNVANGASLFQPVAPEHAKRAIARCCVLLENWAPGQRPLLR